MQDYAKALVAFFGGIGTWGTTVSIDSNITLVEWWGLAGVLATTFGVFIVPNAVKAVKKTRRKRRVGR